MKKGSKKSDWQKINEIFAAVVGLGAAEQAEFLRQIPDDDLQREVEAILAASSRADEQNFLKSDAFAAGACILAESENDANAKKIGNYKILTEIGRGGMGTVYLAEREEFRQQVALKIIKRGMDTDEIIKRFRREREVLAGLSHPCIARLLDGGTTDEDLPYFVMEYITGLSVTRFCDKEKLAIDERLRLFQKICSAVTYIHQNKIVHRDIKPSNILVGKDGEPKLLDFGIAKLLTSETNGKTITLTADENRLFTPEYASPEQILGEHVSPAADIYSLGVVLYELLCGHRPFRLENRPAAEVMEIIKENEPTAPSIAALTIEEIKAGRDTKKILSPEKIAAARQTRPQVLRRRLSGDLDNIALKALRKEPAQRYESVKQFSEDIGRYLEGLPVSARPAGFGYRTAKFFRRKRVSVAFAAILILFAAAASAGWFYFFGGEEKNISSPVLRQVAPRTLAVLPFKNLSAEKADDFLSVGLTDALITKLAGVPQFAVRPLSAVTPLSGENQTTLREKGEKLKVETILEGEFRHEKGRFHVSVRLVRARDNEILWTGDFNEPAKDLVKFQDAFATGIADALSAQLSGDEKSLLARRDTENPEAYRAYLKGRYFWSKRTTVDLKQAAKLFEEATKLDERYAQAFAAVGSCYLILGNSDFAALSPSEAYPKARQSVEKAIELNPNLAEAHLVLSSIQMDFEWNLNASEQSLRRVLEFSPNYATAHQWLAWRLIANSRFDQAAAEFRRARELDPTSLIIHSESAYPAFFAEDYETAHRLVTQVLELDNNFVPARFTLWRVLHHARRYDEAMEQLDALEPVGKDSPLLLMARGRTLAASGKSAEAGKIFAALIERKQKGEYISPLFLSILAVELDKRDEVFRLLDEAFAERNEYLLFLPIAPEFKNLRADARFQDLVRRVSAETMEK